MTKTGLPSSVDELQHLMVSQEYFCTRSLATAIFLSLSMPKPLFLEGEAGVGKTEVAKVLARGLGRRLIRLQCYEGLDSAAALYEWNYPKQILALKLMEIRQSVQDPNIFTEEFLFRRPLLEALKSESEGEPVVLLIDEIDRADEEFEAFLLEILSDFTVSIPELGTISTSSPPIVVLTSNRTREIHDALKRRCLFHWIDYPSIEDEYQILTTKVPGVASGLAAQICRFMAQIRRMDYVKRPGVAETLDWAKALMLLAYDHLDRQAVQVTLGCILKYEDDLKRFAESGNELLNFPCAGGLVSKGIC